MNMEIRKKGKYCVVCPGGELSMIEDTDRLAVELNTLKASGHRCFCIDLSESPVINSSVIGLLVRFHDEVTSKGGEMVIMNARNVALEAMLRTRIDRIIRFVRSEEEL